MGIVVVGSINADITVGVERLPAPGETLVGRGFPVAAGGKGANQAVAAALLGASVSMVGAVGRDANAAPASAILRSSGVDLSAVADSSQFVTGMAMITVADDGENTIIFVPGANSLVDAEFVSAAADTISSADIVLLQGEIPASGFAEAVRLSTARVVINLAPVVNVPRDALLRADPLLANEHEAGLILEQLGLPASSEPTTLIADLLNAGFNSVVLTLGAAGALVADYDGVTVIPSPRVSAVDTTGAGDAFAGALVHRLACGDSLIDAATYAARVGAFSVTRRGAQASYPSSSDILPFV